jgi:hypothetical protein
MNRIFVIAISMVFASMAHAQAASHANAVPHASKAPERATMVQPVVPVSSTNVTRTGNATPVKGNGAKACFQGSGPQDNPTGVPCHHVRTTQM